jgi:phosphohistidine phosphatase
MKTLLIMRHAKSAEGGPEMPDHERPLNPRGERDAPLMGARLRELGIVPDLILSSTAVRALTTARLFAEGNGYAGAPLADMRLYLAEVPAYIKVLAETAGDAETVMVVSHNPGSEELLHYLTGALRPMPTCAVAVVELSEEGRLGRGTGRLTQFLTPKD